MSGEKNIGTFHFKHCLKTKTHDRGTDFYFEAGMLSPLYKLCSLPGDPRRRRRSLRSRDSREKQERNTNSLDRKTSTHRWRRDCCWFPAGRRSRRRSGSATRRPERGGERIQINTLEIWRSCFVTMYKHLTELLKKKKKKKSSCHFKPIWSFFIAVSRI